MTSLRLPTPYPATVFKRQQGHSDTLIVNGVYHFMGCSILSVNMTLGFNGVASSATLTLVEDSVKGDLFIRPDIPTLWAISLPKGGVGVPIFFNNGTSLSQNDFQGSNVPFYFCGICTNWSVTAADVNGRTISVTLTDPKELLTGVQCLLGGFALSQNLGAGQNRFTGVDNVIDVFGYFDYGLESGKNEYGMPWLNIKEALEATRVRLYDMFFEFYYTGSAFNEVPNFYRIDDEIIDIVGLTQKVASDGGSDFVTVARKINSTTAVIEFYAIGRKNSNPLTKTEIAQFISLRSDIVETARIGEEFRNEPNSSIIVGGLKNANYLALPSTYIEEMHGKKKTNGNGFDEDYNAFPSDIKIRLFGGKTTVFKDIIDGNPPAEIDKTFDVKSGAILPFWGFTPDDHAYPLIEPVLPLDHLVFTLDDKAYAELKNRLPYIKIAVKNFTVRVNPHDDVFLDGDGTSDDRPFAYIADIIRGSSGKKPDSTYIRGLPLNTEVLRAAGTVDSYYTFFDLYKLHFPEIADDLGFPSLNSKEIADMVQRARLSGHRYDLRDLKIQDKMYDWSYLNKTFDSVTAVLNSGFIDKSNPVWQNIANNLALNGRRMINFWHLIYELVRQYALDHMGKKWLACLPRSLIMERIWAGLPVPTRPEKPEIEYQVDNRGFWNTIPDELDGIALDNYGVAKTDSEEEQVRRKFMAEDGRFYAMVVMPTKPKGNINFNSNGFNAVMFQDYPVSDFRPNKIADDKFLLGRINRVFVSCNVNQLAKRPDLALVETSTSVNFDPTDACDPIHFQRDAADDEFIATKKGLIKYFWYHIMKNADLRKAISDSATDFGFDVERYASEVVVKWANSLFKMMNYPYTRSHSTEKVMDLEAVSIPLTSTWVSYGPWFADYNSAKGMVKVEIDPSLVPWNFAIPSGVGPIFSDDGKTPLERLDEAGNERLTRSIADVQFLDSATVTVAGFPEYGPAMSLGYNSNLTSISVDFGVGGVRTTYNFATYFARPGTYRKSDYDNVSRARVDLREELPLPENTNLVYNVQYFGTNRFRIY